MSVLGVVTGGLLDSPSEIVTLGLDPAAVVTGGGLVTLGLGLSPSRLVLQGMAVSAGSDWSLEVPTLASFTATFGASGDFGWGWGLVESQAVALTATFGASGDFQFTAPVGFDLDTYTVALTATFGASGDFGFEYGFPQGTAALTAAFGASGDFVFSDAPVPRARRAAGRNYIIRGKRYFNLTNDELMHLLGRELIDVARDDIKVSYENKPARKISRGDFAQVMKAAKKLPKPDLYDDDEESAAMLLL